ncbi:MAG: class I SAM-dependent methyltransferase [Planctomycetota bacterium]
MNLEELLQAADEHQRHSVARSYERTESARFLPEEVTPTVTRLKALAGTGPAVEFAVGTGRIALPLAAEGVEVHGLDASEAMLAELAKKEGAESVEVTLGDMASRIVCEDATLVYLIFNTITNLRTQSQQVECFRNAAAHLRTGGRFLIECIVPALHRLAPGQTVLHRVTTPECLAFDEYPDTTRQILISHYCVTEGDVTDRSAAAFRYVWPSELDLMANLAGMELESRTSDWHGAAFTSSSRSHVSVWRKKT